MAPACFITGILGIFTYRVSLLWSDSEILFKLSVYDGEREASWLGPVHNSFPLQGTEVGGKTDQHTGISMAEGQGSKEPTRKLSQLINTFHKVAGYQINSQKSVILPIEKGQMH